MSDLVPLECTNFESICMHLEVRPTIFIQMQLEYFYQNEA